MPNATFLRHNLTFPVLLVLLFAVTTLPFRSHFPINWDAAQFVLGVRHFSLQMHQPHPPGYPLFIGLARLVNWVIESPHLSVLAVTWAFGLGAVLALYWLVFSLWGNRWAAFLSAVGLLLNPLFWYYREVALTYTVDAFATLLVGGLSCLALERSPRLQYWCAAALGLLAAVRPSIVILLVAVAFFPSLAQRRHRASVTALGLFGIAVLAWLIPLIALSGGLSTFMETSGKLAGYGARHTSLFMGAGVERLIRQLAEVIGITKASCNLMLAPALIGACLHFRDTARLVTGIGFIASWVLPALLVFVFVHLGQAGYLLILIPIVYVMAGRLFVHLLGMRAGLAKMAGLAALTGIILLNGFAFTLLSPEASSSGFQRFVLRKAHLLGLYSAAVIRRNDRKIEALSGIVRSFPVSGTLIITAAPISCALQPRHDPQPDVFRALGTTCPEYRIFHVTPEGRMVLALHQFQTAYLPPRVEISKGGNRLLLFVEEIPSHLMPMKAQNIVRKERPAAHYLGFAADEFEFLGTRFQPISRGYQSGKDRFQVIEASVNQD